MNVCVSGLDGSRSVVGSYETVMVRDSFAGTTGALMLVRENTPVRLLTELMVMGPVPVLVSWSCIVAGPASTSTPPKSTTIPGDSDTAGPMLV